MRLVLDTSRRIALDEREPGADDAEVLLADAWPGLAEVHASFAALTELKYFRTQQPDAGQVAELIAFAKTQPVRWHHSDYALCSVTAAIKAAHKVTLRTR
jgi:hypothetical protein